MHTSPSSPPRPLSLALHTLYAELVEQGQEDLFDPEFVENGSILVRPNRTGAPADHVYYQGYRPSAGETGRERRFARYLGRADDPAIATRIARFRQVKAVRSERASTVRALIGAGMPKPGRMTGRIIEALARAGLFAGDAVLVGDAAYQTYGGVLGVRLADPRKAGVADRPSLRIVVRDGHRAGDIHEIMRAVDPRSGAESRTGGTCRTVTGHRAAVISLNRDVDERSGLVGLLVADPVRAIVLHGPGIPVAVPAPERFAVFALVDSQTSDGSARASTGEDPGALASELCRAIRVAGRAGSLERAIADLAIRMPTGLPALSAAIRRMPDPTRSVLSACLRRP